MKHLMNSAKPIAATLGFFGVALGAFGAHGLKDSVSVEMLAVWKTATFYLLVHVFAALFAAKSHPRIALLFSSGTVVFSGSLYMMVITNQKILGMITPIGGVLYLVSWAWLTYVFYKEVK